MLTVTEKIQPFETYCRVLSYAPTDCLFFDIETTGFSAASSMLFLIGVVRYEAGEWLLTQWLAQGPEDEPAVLGAFLCLSQKYTTLVHFNGQTFDLPYLSARAAAHGLSHKLNEMISLDLYQKFRPLKKPLGLERMNQTTLEAYIGWQRSDRLTGKHMVSLFQKYAASGEGGLRDLLLQHNHDDMIGMTKILSLCACLMLFHGELSSVHAELPSSSAAWRIFFDLEAPLPAALNLDSPYTLAADQKAGTITVPAYLGELKYFFSDHKNYYYLPLEDQAIHKSVATYVDKEYRTPAKPDTCYTRKTGLFFPQPEEIFSPVFRPSLHSPLKYFLWSDSILAENEKLKKYIRALLASYISGHSSYTH